MSHPDKLKSHHIKILQKIDKIPHVNSSDLAEQLDRHPSTISEHTSNLEEWGYINKIDEGKNTFFELTNRGEKTARGGKEKFKSNIRGHAIRFKFPIKRKPSNGFEESRFVRNQSMRNWADDQKINVEHDKVTMINPENICIMIKEVKAIDPYQAIYKAYQIAIEDVAKLCQNTDGLVIGKEQDGLITVAEITKQSYAITNEPYANFRMKLDSPVREDGIEVDASKGVPELEFTDPKTGLIDTNKVLKWYKYISTGKIDLEALESLSSGYTSLRPN